MRLIDADKAKEIMLRLIPEPEPCNTDGAYDDWADGLATGIRRAMIVLDVLPEVHPPEGGRVNG